MTGNEYQKLAMRTDNGGIYSEEEMSVRTLRLMNGLMGLNGEAGEAVDILKKCLFQGHDLGKERDHMIRELGDVAWYLALCADALGCSLDEIFEVNIEKLRHRYPDGFNASNSLNREVGDN